MSVTEPARDSVDDEIQVLLEPCRPRDADAVVAVVQDHFQADIPTPPPGEGARTGTDGNNPVWAFVLHARPRGPKPRQPVQLTDPVNVDLSGPAEAVRRVRELLASSFRVHDRADIPGEHEIELRLQLT
ncbi:hypothetical protein [Streptacidiphilus neutrinimicus]|uniref:hypothetical protein n=1 Tax=Streptacidiphilus neutrinimicus TaxID=105420 RepID=UPI0005AB686B|nr:hypothetical protein [Streptacidiphilus neutrinimicus]